MIDNCVKFSSGLIHYFLVYFDFHVSAFWLEVAYLDQTLLF